MDTRKFKWEDTKKEFKDLIILERMNAIKHFYGEYGCYKTHQKCVRTGKERGWPATLVFEDDCILADKTTFMKRWKEIKKWLDSNMDKWEIFIGASGYSYERHVAEKYKTPNNLLVRLENSTCAHFIYYNQSFYDTFLNFHSEIDDGTFKPLEIKFWESKCRVLTTLPFLAYQRPGYSDIMKNMMDYVNIMLRTEKLLTGHINDNKMYILTKINGGIGNRLFQIAGAYGLAMKQEKNFVINEDYYEKNLHSNVNYFDNILRNIKRDNKVKYTHQLIVRADDVTLYCEYPDYFQNTLVCGFFQNEKYFKDYKLDILKMFEIEPERKVKLSAMFPNISEYYFIHVRRNDYIGNPTMHVDLTGYYKNAINHICKNKKNINIKFKVLSDDIEWCKTFKLFTEPATNYSIEFIDQAAEQNKNLNEVDYLYLMSMCKLGGICANSTYSWWGGYLNENKEKLVTVPKKWFLPPWKTDIAAEDYTIVDM